MDANVTFHPAPVIQKAEGALKRIDKNSNQTIILQEITNDVGQSEKSAINCAHRMKSLALQAKKKADNVIISLAPPNGNKNWNDLIFVANERVASILSGIENISICSHVNLGHSGYPIYELLAQDNTHYLPKGRKMYAENLAQSVLKLTRQ